MKPVLLISLILLLATACIPTRRIQSSHQITDTAWTVKTVTERDTILKLVQDSAQLKLYLNHLMENIRYMNSGERSRVVVYVKDSILYATAYCDSLEWALKLKDIQIENYRNRKEVEKVVEIVEKKVVPPFVKTMAWVGGLIFFLLIVIIIFQFVKIIRPI